MCGYKFKLKFKHFTCQKDRAREEAAGLQPPSSGLRLPRDPPGRSAEVARSREGSQAGGLVTAPAGALQLHLVAGGGAESFTFLEGNRHHRPGDRAGIFPAGAEAAERPIVGPRRRPAGRGGSEAWGGVAGRPGLCTLAPHRGSPGQRSA